MTEAEWLVCTDPRSMLEHLRGMASDRKLRLFGVACCRHVWHSITDERSRYAVEISEQYAEGLASKAELSRAWVEAAAVVNESVFAESAWRVAEDEPEKAVWALGRAFQTSRANKDERKCQALFLRDIFDNLCRPVSVDPAWLTWHDGLLVAMAQQMYDSRDFTDMPVLADALEEAGCANPDILSHCRGPGDHVRGCWVVDLLMGKQ